MAVLPALMASGDGIFLSLATAGPDGSRFSPSSPIHFTLNQLLQALTKAGYRIPTTMHLPPTEASFPSFPFPFLSPPEDERDSC